MLILLVLTGLFSVVFPCRRLPVGFHNETSTGGSSFLRTAQNRKLIFCDVAQQPDAIPCRTQRPESVSGQHHVHISVILSFNTFKLLKIPEQLKPFVLLLF